MGSGLAPVGRVCRRHPHPISRGETAFMEQQILSPPTPTTAATGTTEFSVRRHDLLKELSELHRIVQRKSTVPILGNVLVQATGNLLALTATDLDLSLRTVCSARIKREGLCTVPAHKLYEYARVLEDGDVTISVLENSWLQIRSGRSHTKMVGMTPESFPKLPLFPSESAVRLDRGVLCNLIGKTMFALSREESRYLLNGALLLLKSQGIAMVATDGHRLAVVQYAKAQFAKEARIIVPKKALTQLSALLNSANVEHVLFAQDDSTLFFAIGNRLLTCRQLAGKFPNYEAVLPREKKGAAVLTKEELFTAIQRVAQFSDERSTSVRLPLAKDEFKISSSNTETGESEDVVQATYAGDPAVMAFNSEYLLEFLKVVESSNVRFEFKDAQSAG